MSIPSQASLLGLPYELREQIFGYLFLRQRGQIITKGGGSWPQHYPAKGKRVFIQRPRAYLLPSEGTKGYALFSTQPIAEVNRQLRYEISNFLRFALVDIVATVQKFEYNHIISFLDSLPASKLKDFTVQPDVDADYTRTLHVELSCERDQKYLQSLSHWLNTIDKLFNKDEEFSTAVSLAIQPKIERAPLTFLLKLYHRWAEQAEGPAREDLRKIMVVFWARLRLEGLMITGIYQRDPIGSMGFIPLEAEEDQFMRWIWLGF